MLKLSTICTLKLKGALFKGVLVVIFSRNRWTLDKGYKYYQFSDKRAFNRSIVCSYFQIEIELIACEFVVFGS